MLYFKIADLKNVDRNGLKKRIVLAEKQKAKVAGSLGRSKIGDDEKTEAWHQSLKFNVGLTKSEAHMIFQSE
jgi:hypothetical protein